MKGHPTVGMDLLERLLDTRWQQSPGGTAVNLMRECGAFLVATELEEEFEQANIMSNVTTWTYAPRPARDWLARRGDWWLYALDKNGTYLGACAGLSLPVGRVARDRPDDYVHAGYFQVAHGDHPPRWVTTPELRHLVQGEEFEHLHYLGSWTWDDQRRALASWQARLARAREALADILVSSQSAAERERAADALDGLKALYTQGIGWLRGSWLTRDDLLRGTSYHRPPWRDFIMAEAVTRLKKTWTMLPADQEWRAVGVYDTDTFLIATPRPAPPFGLRYGPQLGAWKVKRSVRVGDHPYVYEALIRMDDVNEDGRRWALRDLYRALVAGTPADDEDADG